MRYEFFRMKYKRDVLGHKGLKDITNKTELKQNEIKFSWEMSPEKQKNEENDSGEFKFISDYMMPKLHKMLSSYGFQSELINIKENDFSRVLEDQKSILLTKNMTTYLEVSKRM